MQYQYKLINNDRNAIKYIMSAKFYPKPVPCRTNMSKNTLR